MTTQSLAPPLRHLQQCLAAKRIRTKSIPTTGEDFEYRSPIHICHAHEPGEYQCWYQLSNLRMKPLTVYLLNGQSSRTTLQVTSVGLLVRRFERDERTSVTVCLPLIDCFCSSHSDNSKGITLREFYDLRTDPYQETNAFEVSYCCPSSTAISYHSSEGCTTKKYLTC